MWSTGSFICKNLSEIYLNDKYLWEIVRIIYNIGCPKARNVTV
jgi:hypothetical protein